MGREEAKIPELMELHSEKFKLKIKSLKGEQTT